MNLLSLGTVPTVNLLLYMLVMLLSFIAAYLIIISCENMYGEIIYSKMSRRKAVFPLGHCFFHGIVI